MADNQITYTDLVKPTDSITNAIAQLTQLETQYIEMMDNIKKEAADVEKSIKSVSGATAKQRKQITEAEKQTKKLSRAQEVYETSLNDTAKELASLRLKQAEQNKITKLTAKLNASAEGSYDKLSAQYSLNKIRLNQMSAEERNATKAGIELEQQTRELHEEMKRLQEATGNHSLSVGDYKNSITEALKEQDFFGVSVNKLGTMFTTTTGIIGVGVAAITGLAKAYVSSARGAKDLQRASDRLDIIMKNLGNTIADTIGDENVLDGLLSGMQSMFAGYQSAIDAGVLVLRRETLRELELDLQEDERIKKSLLDRAEVFRQVRDEERNSIIERRNANLELGKVIDERERGSIKIQKQKLFELKMLLKADEGNLELSKQIKEVELEIADIKEEAQGFRSEMLLNDLALSREVNENELALLEEKVRGELLVVEEGSKERLEIEKNLVNARLDLELDFAGDNAQLQAIANEKSKNDIKELELAYTKFQEERTRRLKEEQDKRRKLEEAEREKERKEIERRNAESARDFAKAVADAEKAERLREQEEKARFDSFSKVIEEEKKLRDSEIDLLETTEEEKTRLRLDAEKDRLKKIIDLNQTEGARLSGIQLKIIENQIQLIDKKLEEAAKKKDLDLYSLAGIKLSSDEKGAIRDSTQFAKDNVSDYLQFQIDAADIAVDNSQRQIDAAEERLNREIETRNAGYAADVSNAERELALAKSTQDKALKDQQEAQRAQATIDSIQQASNLVTASAKIWSQLGFPSAIPAIGIMWGSFAAAKIKAAEVSRPITYGDGGLEILGGGTHASGNDTIIGYNNGYELRGEKNEAVAIINAEKTAKYRNVLPDVVDSLNQGIFEDKYLGGMLGGSGDVNVNVGLDDMPKHIRRMANKKNAYVDHKGRTIVEYKNVKTIYV